MRLLTILFLCFSFSLSAQQEPENYKAVTAELVRVYNSGSYSDFRGLFSDIMLKDVPLEELSALFDAMKPTYGKMEAFEFKRINSNKLAEYKTKFQQGILLTRLSADQNNKITGLVFGPYSEMPAAPVLERNKTSLSLPFKGEWLTAWGGDTKEQNYHVESQAQKNAFDFFIVDEKGASHKGDDRKNESYYAFGKEIIAPCDAMVTDVVDGVRDNIPGEMNTLFIPGNWILLKTANDEYLFFAHLKQHSIKLREGDKVKKGDLLGLCGNSGHSSEPHLHFHIQNTWQNEIATGAKAFFSRITVTNANGTQVKESYSPIKGDKIKN